MNARPYHSIEEIAIGDVVRHAGDDGAFATCIISGANPHGWELTRPHARVTSIAGGHHTAWLATETFVVTSQAILERWEVYVTGRSSLKDGRRSMSWV